MGRALISRPEMVTSMHALILSAKFHTWSISLSREITKTSFRFLALAALIQCECVFRVPRLMLQPLVPLHVRSNA
jgi:hypothetical protein